MNEATLRVIDQVIKSQRTVEGAGFKVRRPFPTSAMDHIDPFLLLDEMGPSEYAPGEAVGAPSHPHRGFETVTYLLSGAMEHVDTTGARAVIRPGGVQWMTAGSGVVHSELPTADMMRLGGRMHGFQLWVNLPAAKKMVAPRYQGYEADELTVVALPNGGSIKIVAGMVHGAAGPVETTSPMTYAHAVLEPADVVEWSPEAGHTALVHVFVGGATVYELEAQEGVMVVCSRICGTVRVSAGITRTEVLLLGGQPLGEPVSRYGPFVMNMRQEIVQAVDDYQNGRLVQ